jgi:ankyrin repeat protein
MIGEIFWRLSTPDLLRVARVSQYSYEVAMDSLMRRAWLYGYLEADVGGAGRYLKGILETLRVLIQWRCIPEEYVVRRPSSSIDLEMTLRKVKDSGSKVLEEALAACIWKGKLELVRTLLLVGADPNHVRMTGGSSLHLAAWLGRAEMVALLFKHGANVDSLAATGDTALILAMETKKVPKEVAMIERTVRVLLDAKADPNLRGGSVCSPLHLAACQGLASVVALLLKRGANVDSLAANGDTALVVAIETRGVPKEDTAIRETVKELLDAGADPTIRTRHGESAVTLAAYLGHVGALELLLRRHKVIANDRDAYGNTVLCRAIGLSIQDSSRTKEKITEMVRLLLEAGACPDVPSRGGTPLDWAIHWEYPGVKALLLKRLGETS